jgi:hypothetical protein
MHWNRLVASVGHDCAVEDIKCRLSDINHLAMRGYDLRNQQQIHTTQLTLLHQLWQPTGTYADSDYVALIIEARRLDDSAMVHDLCARYFYPAPTSTQAALRRYNLIKPEYDGDIHENAWLQPWAEVANDQAIALISTWDDCRFPNYHTRLSEIQQARITDKAITLASTWAQCKTVLREYYLSASQADKILAKSARLAEDQPLDAWWQIYETASA